MNKAVKRKRLFELGERAARSIGIADQGYPCPICARVFDANSLKNGELTVEHVPQRTAGGKGILLTCAECNNFAGHSYEYSIKERGLLLKQAEALVGNVPGSFGRMKMKIGDTVVNVEYSVDENKKEFRILEANDPKAIDALHNSLAAFEKGSEMQVSLGHAYSNENVKRSELKSAFLAITAKFGYTIALHRRMAPIRNAILNRGTPDDFLRYLELPTKNFQGILVDESSGLTGVAIHEQIILLPWPSREFEGFKEQESININGRLFPFPRSFEAHIDLKAII